MWIKPIFFFMNLAVEGAGRVEKSFFFLVGTPGLWPVKFIPYFYVKMKINFNC